MLGILMSILSAGNSFIYKRSLEVGAERELSQSFMTWSYAVNILVLTVILLPIIVWLDLTALSDFKTLEGKIFLIVVINSCLAICTELLNQTAYTNEKLSVLAPFSQLDEILTIIVAGIVAFTLGYGETPTLLGFLFAL